MAARSVVVVMPFGDDNSIERRMAILNFKRLEYLVRNRCKVTKTDRSGEAEPVTYAVETARTWTKEVPERVLKQIENADIVIALLIENHPTVIYELAFRLSRSVDGPVILIADSPNNLPLYVKSLGRQSWTQVKVLQQIDRIAKDDPLINPLPDFAVGIPEDLRKAIDNYDTNLQVGLEQALLEIETSFVLPHSDESVQHLREIVSENTTTFYPCSIVEYQFQRHGEFANPNSPGIVTHFDDAFCRLYGYAGKKQALNDRPLTLEHLLEKLDPLLDKRRWKEFADEQHRLLTTAIVEYRFARATIPLTFNDTHSDEFKGKSYLPCTLAQVVDGDTTGPHRMHILVVYIQLPA